MLDDDSTQTHSFTYVVCFHSHKLLQFTHTNTHLPYIKTMRGALNENIENKTSGDRSPSSLETINIHAIFCRHRKQRVWIFTAVCIHTIMLMIDFLAYFMHEFEIFLHYTPWLFELPLDPAWFWFEEEPELPELPELPLELPPLLFDDPVTLQRT